MASSLALGSPLTTADVARMLGGAPSGLADVVTKVVPPPAPEEPPQDWTDRTMQLWQRIPPNPQGGGDFPNAADAGMHSHDLLNGANPREVINPDAAGVVGQAGQQRVAVSPGSMGSHFVPKADWTNGTLSQVRPVAPDSDPNMRTNLPSVNVPPELDYTPWSQPRGATNVADQTQMPTLGPLPGQAYLNPQIAPQVPAGSPRPMAPGEYVKNPQGSWSSEITTTTEPGVFSTLNGGAPTVIPTLWVINGVPTRVDEDTAAQLAVQSGLRFPGFKTAEEAEAFSQAREDSWQTVQPENAASVPALWAAPSGGQ